MHSKKLRQSDSAEWDTRMRTVRACNVAELVLALTLLVIRPAMYNEDERAALAECQGHVRYVLYCAPFMGSKYDCTPEEYSQGFRQKAIGLAVIACVFLGIWPYTLQKLREKSASTAEGIYDSAPA